MDLEQRGKDRVFDPARIKPRIESILGGLGFAGLGAGADTNGPLAVAVIGGLVSSTLLTLVVVPALYSLVEHRVEAFRRRRAGAGRRAEAAG